MGRDGEGDTPADPTTVLEYDVFAWRDRGEPNFSHARVRETHADANTRWLHTYTYTDGAGNVLLSKATAEPGLAPQRDANGDLVLVNDEVVLVQAASRWVGSGRTIFDNKGNPVRQYEPYFSSTEAYEDEDELRAHGVSPLMHYDPLGRLLQTDFPDGTSAAVAFTPWMQTTWDQNDRVSGSDWEAERLLLPANDPAHEARDRTVEHDDTPSVVHLDAMGRTVRGIAENVVNAASELYETRTVMDVQGNALEVIDARGNTAEERVFGMVGQPLQVTSVDGGTARSITSIMGLPLRSYNERGFASRSEFDAAWRPTHGWVREGAGAEQLVMRTVYGEALASPTALNHRGQAYRVYDSAGVTTATAFDWKGNALASERRLADDYETTPDWLALALLTDIAAIETAANGLLQTEAFTTSTTYDGLSRPATQTTPDGSVTELAYNDAGMLEGVEVAVRGATPADVCVSNIDYDVKGRRELIAYGNGTETTYAYDERTLRLTQVETVRTSDSATLQSLQYTYDPVGNITHITDGAQQTVYFNNAVVTATQTYTYDALYRLIEATGREHTSQGQPISSELTPGAHPHPNDPSAMRTYVESYIYDAVGNIEQMQHVASGGNWTRRYNYATDGNRLLSTQAPGDPDAGPFTHTYAHDVHGNIGHDPLGRTLRKRRQCQAQRA